MTAIFPTSEQIREAAERLRRGELVVFPTETVYGLGAHALDARAVQRIFEVKHRPRTSPLIVHVASIQAARDLVTEWPDSAERLARRFWPGPLSIVLPKKDIVPDIVTADLGTVGLRVPNHPVALALLREADLPIAAPSANLFTRLSPTASGHVTLDAIPVLEGGDSEVGIESTVVSLVGAPRLFRPGAVTRAELENCIGFLSDAPAREGESPGLHLRHYQPLTPVTWAGRDFPAGPGAYLFHRNPRPAHATVQMPADPAAYASKLYRVLHDLDAKKLAWIAIEPIPDSSEWAAVRDRLNRAISEDHRT